MDAWLLNGSSEDDGGNLTSRVWVESKKVWSIATPGIIARVSTIGLLVVTQTYMGHISAIDLATYALSQILNMKFASGILLGMSSATETLCGQAYGAGKNHMMGIYLQKSWIIDFITTTILLPIFIFATPIFKLLGIEKSLSEEAQKISLWFIPVIYIYIFIFTFQMYLQAQLKNKIIAWLSASSLITHLMLSWLFVIKLNLGIPGAMGSLIMSYLLTVIGEFVYVLGGWCPDSWKGFTIAAFYDLWPMTKLSSFDIFRSDGLGLWIGMLSGVVVQSAILGFITWKTDWEEQVNKASERLDRWFVKPSEEPDESLNHA